MEIYEKSYREAVEANAESEKRWRRYKEELEKTKENLNYFVESHQVDIMVPIGKKALVRGKLVHTNEVTVSHGTSYFSDCSTKQATEIIDRRIKNCDKQLEALEKEKELFTNKIDLPFGAFSDSKEIIEEFDEETEAKWKQKHAESVRRQKMKERDERKKNRNTKDDINKMFDEFEIMEELAEELENMKVKDDDTLKKILSGEIKVSESRKRVARIPIPDEKPQETLDLCNQPQENSLIAQNNMEIIDLLRNYRLKIKEVLRNVKKDDERNLNLFLDLIELKDDIEDDIRRMNDDETLESDEKDSDDETSTSMHLKTPEEISVTDQKRVRFSTSLEDVKLIESKSELYESSQSEENNTIEIYFQHSKAKFNPPTATDTIMHPGEIPIMHKPTESQVPAKSILKNKEKDVNFRETMDEKQVKKVFLSDTPVIGDVIEHRKILSDENIIHVEAKQKVPQKESKFKQMRKSKSSLFYC